MQCLYSAAIGLSMAADASSEHCMLIVEPSRDNTLVQIADGSLSLAVSPFVFAGRTGNHGGGGTLRRGLIMFDLSALIPRNAVVVEASLEVFCTQTNSGPFPVKIHRVLQDWGEGTSTAPGGGGGPATVGDATWLHTFWPDQFWNSPGGDFAREPSATDQIGFPGPYVIESTPGLIADVQQWVRDPESNFGWILVGDEVEFQSVKAIASRENRLIEQRPHLKVVYNINELPSPDLDNDGVVGGADLGLLLSSWGDCMVNQPCDADLDGSAVVDGGDLGLLLVSWTG